MAADMPSLLSLYAASEVSRSAEPGVRVQPIWQETLAHPGVTVLVSDAANRIAASCMLITRRTCCAAGPHGFLENIVTSRELRRLGYGGAVVSTALERA